MGLILYNIFIINMVWLRYIIFIMLFEMTFVIYIDRTKGCNYHYAFSSDLTWSWDDNSFLKIGFDACEDCNYWSKHWTPLSFSCSNWVVPLIKGLLFFALNLDYANIFCFAHLMSYFNPWLSISDKTIHLKLFLRF